jgi:hypothetical protein
VAVLVVLEHLPEHQAAAHLLNLPLLLSKELLTQSQSVLVGQEITTAITRCLAQLLPLPEVGAVSKME